MHPLPHVHCPLLSPLTPLPKGVNLNNPQLSYGYMHPLPHVLCPLLSPLTPLPNGVNLNNPQ